MIGKERDQEKRIIRKYRDCGQLTLGKIGKEKIEWGNIGIGRNFGVELESGSPGTTKG